MKNYVVILTILLLFVGSSAQTSETQSAALSIEIIPSELRQLNPLQDMARIQPYYPSVCYDSVGLDSFIRATMQSEHIPGVATWCGKNGQAIWEQYYGYARLEDSTPVTDSTIFSLMSISKTITGTAIMQLWERGEFGLDDDVNDYLSFNVRNPSHPDSAITFRMLMTHTSSIQDYSLGQYLVHGDSPIALGEFVGGYLVPGGTYYNPNNYSSAVPGTEYDYCNVAVALLGCLVEAMEDSFPIHCQDSIFQPLDMDATSWFIANLNLNNVAMGYHWNGSHYDSTGLWGMPYYPAATLRATTSSLAQHLAAITQYGIVDSTRILDSTTVDLILSPHFVIDSTYWFVGLTWHFYYDQGRWIWFHSGEIAGFRTFYGFCPAESSAFIVLTNGEADYTGTIPIAWALMDYAQEYGIDENLARPIKVENSGPTIFSGPLQLPKDKQCKVFDITGRVVQPNKMTRGIYFIEIDDRIVQKVIKVR